MERRKKAKYILPLYIEPSSNTLGSGMYQTVTSKAMLLRNEAGYETKQLVTDQSRRANKTQVNQVFG